MNLLILVADTCSPRHAAGQCQTHNCGESRFWKYSESCFYATKLFEGPSVRLGIRDGSFKTRPADILAVDCIRNELPLVKETVSRRDVFSIALSRPDQQDGLWRELQ